MAISFLEKLRISAKTTSLEAQQQPTEGDKKRETAETRKTRRSNIGVDESVINVEQLGEFDEALVEELVEELEEFDLQANGDGKITRNRWVAVVVVMPSKL